MDARSKSYGCSMLVVLVGCGAGDPGEPNVTTTSSGAMAVGSGAGAGGVGSAGGPVTATVSGASSTGGSSGGANGGAAGSSTGNAGMAGGSDAEPVDARDASSVDASTGDATDARPRGDAAFDITGDGPSSSRQTQRLAGANGAPLGYYEYLPTGYGDGTARPVLFFFHGVGENGNGTTELSRVLAHGPPKLVSMDQWPATRPFVVLSPQHPPIVGPPDPIYGGFDCWTPNEIHDFVAFGTSHYDIDPKRIYITGLSCGALGSGNYLKQYGTDQQVVAAVLISGNASIFWPTRGCPLVQQMGLWTLHGDADDTVSIVGDNAAMPQFLACAMPRKDVKYTVYPGVGHDAWTRTYDLSAGNDVYSWLLGFTR